MKKQMRHNLVNIVKSMGTVLILILVLTVGFISRADEGVVKGTDVNVRSEASATSTAVGTVTTNDKVTITEEAKDADGKTWYKIKSSTGIEGYVRSDFITKTESNTNTDTGTTTTESTTKVTPIEEKTAYIAGNGNVNIRKEASTKSALVASAKGQSEITITGEAKAADNYKWYEIKFKADGKEMKGFIRSDLITFEAPTSDPAETIIEGNGGEPAVTTEPEGGEEGGGDTGEPVEPEPENPATANAISKNITFLDPDEAPPVIPAGFEKMDITIAGDKITGWGKGDFYILYAIKGESEPAWYVCDYKNGGYINYDGLFEANTKKTSDFDGRILIIVMAGLLIVALVAIALLAVKLTRKGDDYDEYDYDYDDEEEESDEYEAVESETEEEYEEPKEEKTSKKRKEKKSKSSGGIKNFFTKEADEEEYDEFDDDAEEESVSAQDLEDDDDDDDDFNFIDL